MTNGQWVRTPDAAKILGVSKTTLRRRRQDKTLLQGTHYLKTSSSDSAWILYNIDELKNALGDGGAK